MASQHSCIRPILPERITFVTSEELYRRWPDLHPREREHRICEEHRAVFIIGIGGELPDGSRTTAAPGLRRLDHSAAATAAAGLNGDILLWNPVLERAFEISSMGIRVDPPTLRKQLEIRGLTIAKAPFHRMLLAGELPQTMGGGIGQSRMCMFFLAPPTSAKWPGIWPDEMVQRCAAAQIDLL